MSQANIFDPHKDRHRWTEREREDSDRCNDTRELLLTHWLTILATGYFVLPVRLAQSHEFSAGITNGAAWYALYGGMQDWNYLNTANFELTLELSDIKWPPASMLEGFWADNQMSLVALIRELFKGARGRVTDAETNQPILDASVEVRSINHPVTVDSLGYYYRPLVAGDYTVRVSAFGYLSRELPVHVPEGNYAEVNVQLSKVGRA
jgi:carboxypeptidase D